MGKLDGSSWLDDDMSIELLEYFEYLSTIMRRAANFASRLPFSIIFFGQLCGFILLFLWVGILVHFNYPASLLFSSPTFSIGSTFLTYAFLLSFAVENLVVFFWGGSMSAF